MLHSEWLKSHRKEIVVLLIANLIIMVFLGFHSVSRTQYLEKDGKEVVAIIRDNPEQILTLPLEIEADKDGKIQRYEVTISLNGLPQEPNDPETALKKKGEERAQLEEVIASTIDEIERKQDVKIFLPNKLEDGTRLRWKPQKNFRFLLTLLLLPACLLYLYETDRQRKKEQRKRYEDEIRRALPSFVDQLLLLLNCGMIFHDAFYRIASGYTARKEQDAFSRLLARIRKEADETGFMVITIMKNMSQEVGLREYVRIVNIVMDHQHRGVNLEEKLQGESQLLWEGRKTDSIQKGKEMETKMTFPLALLLLVLMMIAGMPAIMNM